jgi:hypothetical protein
MSLTISLTPAEVERRLATLGIECAFSQQERDAFATTPLVHRSDRIFVFPTPSGNGTLTLGHIRSCTGTDPKRQPCFFDHPWYQTEEFMSARCEPGWHILTMDPIAGSIQQPVNYLDSPSESGLELPQAIEVVLMLFLHYVGTGEQLLLKKHSWCCEVASLNRHVTVGAFGRNGVFLSGHPANFSSQGLGVCAKIRAPKSA